MRFVWIVLLGLNLAGCATAVVYNPMQVASQEELLLNESGFKALQDGMTMDQVHQIMGSQLVIGYELASPQSSDYKPLTIPNPYKTAAIKGTDYFIEYYIEAIRQPNGIISDDELMPLIFKKDKLIGHGWALVKSLPSA